MFKKVWFWPRPINRLYSRFFEYSKSERFGGPRFFWSFINPRNFHFYCIFGPLFWQLELYRGQKNRLFFEKFRKNSGIFHKIHKTPKISVKIGSKTSKWSKFGLILPFLPKNGHFCVEKHCFFENFGAFGAEIWSFIGPSGADYLELRPPFGPSPPQSLWLKQKLLVSHEKRKSNG